MRSTYLLHDLVIASAERDGDAAALTFGGESLSYADTAQRIIDFAAAYRELGLLRGERVAVYLDKRPETVAAMFGATLAGGAFVPVNPILKADQVAHILRDCTVRVLVTSRERLGALRDIVAPSGVHDVVVVGDADDLPALADVRVHRATDLARAGAYTPPRLTESDIAAIFYTSGSTGRPKGVVLCHRNLVVGAKSVAQYLENGPHDVLLAALPLSFDAGFSQLTTAFHSGARVVLLNYLMPRDVINALSRERVTGLTAVPPLWIQLARLEWPHEIDTHLRYFANTGGRMPFDTLTKLRAKVPNAKPYLMYGLTEAFRATYLPPEQVDARPDSIGKAIPNAEVLVLREDGTPCGPNEPGELVQRGPLVALGYWNNPEATAERFKPLPPAAVPNREGVVLPEIAVFSGDTVRMDEEGFLYFIGRRDEMIKTSGYRVSPTEIEEVIYSTGLVAECVAVGVPDDTLGQAIWVIAAPPDGRTLETDRLLDECRKRLPAYMVPAHIEIHAGALPRNPNGKLDRNALKERVLAARVERPADRGAQTLANA